MLRTTRKHPITDTNAPFEVDPFARKITVPYTGRVIGVVGDHCSEKVRFKIPKLIDGHNMVASTRKYVAWQNVNGEPGTDALELIEEAEDYALYTWLVRDMTAAAKGLVSFSLHFECDDETGQRIYSWGTQTCTDCEILDSVNAILGAFAAICVDGETLVFADYAPVKGDALELQSAIVPKDTLDINTPGKQYVGPYAYVDVKGLYETPSITMENGIITATANGLSATQPLDAGALAKKVNVHIEVKKATILTISYQKMQPGGIFEWISDPLNQGEVVNFIPAGTALDIQVPIGGVINFSDVLLTAANIQASVQAVTYQYDGTVLWLVPDGAEKIDITVA